MRPNRITRACASCGIEFTIPAAWARRGGGKFCSRACKAARQIPRDRFFLPHVDRAGDCWLWTRPSDQDGYGSAWDPVAKRAMPAHRLALTIAIGADLPPGMVACHTCDNRLCVRNDDPGIYVINGVARPRFGHLWLGSSADNTADKMQKSRHVTQRGDGHHHARFTEQDIRTMHDWYGRGIATSGEIARIFGTRREAVTEIARAEGWTHLGLPRIQTKIISTRHRNLTAAERLATYRHLRATGQKQADVAEHFGISKSLVSLIVTRHRHLEKNP